jgi:hypothetical protein
MDRVPAKPLLAACGYTAIARAEMRRAWTCCRLDAQNEGGREPSVDRRAAPGAGRRRQPARRQAETSMPAQASTRSRGVPGRPGRRPGGLPGGPLSHEPAEAPRSLPRARGDVGGPGRLPRSTSKAPPRRPEPGRGHSPPAGSPAANANSRHHRRVPQVDPELDAALRRLRAAFGFVEVLEVIDHRGDQDQPGDDQAPERGPSDRR